MLVSMVARRSKETQEQVAFNLCRVTFANFSSTKANHIELNSRGREITPSFNGKGFKISWLYLQSTTAHPPARINSKLLKWKILKTHILGPLRVPFNCGIWLKAHDLMIYFKSRCRWGHVDANDQEQLVLIQRPNELKRDVIYLLSMNSYMGDKNKIRQTGHSHSKRGKSGDK